MVNLTLSVHAESPLQGLGSIQYNVVNVYLIISTTI
jgi:hypothetical protein